MKLKISVFIILFLFFSLAKSQDLPKEQLNQYSLNHDIRYEADTLRIKITNSLSCPLRVNFVFPILTDQKIINDKLQFTVAENIIFEKKIFAPDLRTSNISFTYDWAFGDDHKTIKKNNLALPFPKGKQYTVMQANNGSLSHNDDYARYAIDFDMKVGDTITSADDGYVVGVIKDYQYGGSDIKWKPYANYISIYHPQSGLFTQYVHLKKEGSFVTVGDIVKRNQPIGLSGETGYVSGAHLHFNVLVPEKNKTLISTPFSFENNLDAKSLKQNMKVKK